MGALFAVLVAGSGIAGGVVLFWRPHTRPAVIAVIIGLLLAFVPAARRPVSAARLYRSVPPPIFGVGPRRIASLTAAPASVAAHTTPTKAAPVDRRAEPGIVLRHSDTARLRIQAAPVDPRTEPTIILHRPSRVPQRVLPATSIRTLARSAANIAARDGQGPIVGTVKAPEGNVRSGPGKTNSIIGTVMQGDQLIFIGRSGDWYLVQLSDQVSTHSQIAGKQGWVSTILISPLDQEPPLVASAVRAPRWEASDPDFIFQKDGVFHFQVTGEQSANPISARLDAPANASPVEEMSFMATLAWSQGHAPGGMIMHALLGDGRELTMRIGPGEGFPWVDFTLDGQELTTRGRGFPLYTATPIRLAWNGRNVMLSIADDPRIELPVTSPVKSVRFEVETEEGCIFHLKVAEMRVKYAE